MTGAAFSFDLHPSRSRRAREDNWPSAQLPDASFKVKIDCLTERRRSALWPAQFRKSKE
jgi:hypothetical protein